MHDGPDAKNPPQDKEGGTLEAFYAEHKDEALLYSISRLGPATIDGWSARGLLTIEQAPIPEEAIADRYGGGQYLARIMTEGKNWETTFEFEIEGEPKPVKPQVHDVVFGMPGARQLSQEEASKAQYNEAVAYAMEAIQRLLRVTLERNSQRKASEASEEEMNPFQPPAQLTMPRDVAHRLLMEMYGPKEPEPTNRPFRVGMMLGSAINMAGVQVLSEDLLHMLTHGVDMFSKRLSGKHAANPMIPFAAVPPVDFKNFANDLYRDIPGGPVRAEPTWDPNVHHEPAPPGFGGIPPMPDIGPAMKAEAVKRWEDLLSKDPDKAKRMQDAGFDVEGLFENFEQLFGDFFPQKPEAPEYPEEEPQAAPPVEEISPEDV